MSPNVNWRLPVNSRTTTFRTPHKQDEWTLRRLRPDPNLNDEKVCVKLYLAEPLHAKLYLAHRPDDNFNKIQAIMGSSNLTYSGLTKQGELNAVVWGQRQCSKTCRLVWWPLERSFLHRHHQRTDRSHRQQLGWRGNHPTLLYLSENPPTTSPTMLAQVSRICPFHLSFSMSYTTSSRRQ
jgi:hypothetical protein